MVEQACHGRTANGTGRATDPKIPFGREVVVQGTIAAVRVDDLAPCPRRGPRTTCQSQRYLRAANKGAVSDQADKAESLMIRTPQITRWLSFAAGWAHQSCPRLGTPHHRASARRALVRTRGTMGSHHKHHPHVGRLVERSSCCATPGSAMNTR